MRKGLLVLCFLTLLIHISLPVSAWEAPDMTQTGSIRLTIPGGNMLLYRVGAVVETDGTFCFVPTGDFSDCDSTFADLDSPELANNLAVFARANRCEGTPGILGSDGSVAFTDLLPGLYLLVQTEAAPEYEMISPFLVSLPVYEEDSYSYQIDATPKFQLTTLPTEPLPSLPQTGQLKWPVPLLGLSGCILFLVGIALQRSRYE